MSSLSDGLDLLLLLSSACGDIHHENPHKSQRQSPTRPPPTQSKTNETNALSMAPTHLLRVSKRTRRPLSQCRQQLVVLTTGAHVGGDVVDAADAGSAVRVACGAVRVARSAEQFAGSVILSVSCGRSGRRAGSCWLVANALSVDLRTAVTLRFASEHVVPCLHSCRCYCCKLQHQYNHKSQRQQLKHYLRTLKHAYDS